MWTRSVSWCGYSLGRSRECERTRGGRRKRRRKIAGAPSGRPPTEGNELGLVPGPATYIPARWKVKTPLSLFLPIWIAIRVTLEMFTAGFRYTSTFFRPYEWRAGWYKRGTFAGGRTLPFVGSLTHRLRRILRDSRCPAKRARGNNFAPIDPCHWVPWVRWTGRGCQTPRAVVPPPRCRVAWPFAQSSPGAKKSRVAPFESRYDPPTHVLLWCIHPDVNNEQLGNMPRRGSMRWQSRSHWQRPRWVSLNKSRTRTPFASPAEIDSYQ